MSQHNDHLEPYKARFGLSYQVNFLRLMDSVTSLAGKRVLEIGGSNLPRELVFEGLGAKQWICADALSVYSIHDVREENPLLRDHYARTRVFRPDDDPAAVLAEDYAIVDCEAGEIAFEDHFDIAISICAFEHVHRFPIMLDRVHAALRMGGQLMSLYSPIWSGLNGHHVVGVVDAAGNEIDFTSTAFIPPWGHLLLSPPELYRFLCERTDPKAAADVVYEVHNSTQVNRLFVEDYMAYVEHSKFRVTNVTPLAPRPPPEDIEQVLRARHPGRRNFDATTIFIHAAK